MNEKLFVRNPEETELGRKIIQQSITLIYDSGFEVFTFKKLALCIGTTEASIYRYFENKHRLLIYIIAWYWSWLEYQVLYHTHGIRSVELKIKKVIQLLTVGIEDVVSFKHIDKEVLHEIVIAEGAKAYLTKHVTEDNKDKLFKPYKDLCARIANLIIEYNPHYQYSHSLASSIVEIAHQQFFFKRNLPALTDFGNSKNSEKMIGFIENIVFSVLKKK